MILDAASSSTCKGASSGTPSSGSPQNQPTPPRPSPGPHSAPAPTLSGPPTCAVSTSSTPLSLYPSYFHVKLFDLKVLSRSANIAGHVSDDRPTRNPRARADGRHGPETRPDAMRITLAGGHPGMPDRTCLRDPDFG